MSLVGSKHPAYPKTHPDLYLGKAQDLDTKNYGMLKETWYTQISEEIRRALSECKARTHIRIQQNTKGFLRRVLSQVYPDT